MLTALDHVVLLCPDIEIGVATYQTLLGAPPVWQATGSGAATAVFLLGNTALELMGPQGEGEIADKLREMTESGARLTTLAFRAENIVETQRVLSRRGLEPSDLSSGESTHTKTGATRHWQRFRVPDARMAGVKTFVLEPGTGSELRLPEAKRGSVSALDHIVITTPNPERAVATYAGRMGLRFALDRTIEALKTRFLFFRIGELTLEFIHRLDQGQSAAGHDAIWGLTWASDDLETAHKRLAAAKLSVSDIREGRKPGSRVFTVRDGTLGVPTLFIQHTPR